MRLGVEGFRENPWSSFLGIPEGFCKDSAMLEGFKG